jgi:hypothetical protein
MFVTPKQILILQLAGQAIRTTADHPFFVQRRGWTNAGDLQLGDRVRVADGQIAPVDAIAIAGEQAVVCQMDPNVPPFPFSGLWPAGTMFETPEGLKPIEEIEPGDRIVFRKPFDPEQN